MLKCNWRLQIICVCVCACVDDVGKSHMTRKCRHLLRAVGSLQLIAYKELQPPRKLVLWCYNCKTKIKVSSKAGIYPVMPQMRPQPQFQPINWLHPYEMLSSGHLHNQHLNNWVLYLLMYVLIHLLQPFKISPSSVLKFLVYMPYMYFVKLISVYIPLSLRNTRSKDIHVAEYT